MEIGIDSFVINSPATPQNRGLTTAERMSNLLEEIERADKAGLDVFGIGEHHRHDFADSAPAVILAAAAARTRRIRLTSAVTVLSADDPVRVFQNFATLDLISKGRAELVVGRGSFVDAYPLFGLNLEDYDDLFVEKLELLLKIRASPTVHWSGRFRPALTGQGVYPRPVQDPLPIWLGVGGTPQSFARAGMLGLPLMVAIIGGLPEHFRPLIDLYRKAGHDAGHPPERLKVGIHSLGYVAESSTRAADDFAPGYIRSFTEIGKERGWSPTTRAHFDAGASPRGALFVGDAETVAAKILSLNEKLGGISRFTFQMSVAALPHERALQCEAVWDNAGSVCGGAGRGLIGRGSGFLRTGDVCGRTGNVFCRGGGPCGGTGVGFDRSGKDFPGAGKVCVGAGGDFGGAGGRFGGAGGDDFAAGVVRGRPEKDTNFLASRLIVGEL